MTLALSALISTTGITAASANVQTHENANQSIDAPAGTIGYTTPLKPGVTIPLIKQSSIIDRLSSVTSQAAISADPNVKLSFERPSVASIPDPAIAAKKKADEEAKVAAEKATEAKAAEAKVVAEKAAAVASAAPGTGTRQRSTSVAPEASPSAPTANLPQNLSSYQQYAAQAMTARGLNGAAELTCLIPLWNHESGWNPNAANPSSTARGIPQMMMNIHYGANWQTSAAGVAYLTNPQVQIDKGLDYILGRYGSPCNAWNTWQTQSWY